MEAEGNAEAKPADAKTKTERPPRPPGWWALAATRIVVGYMWYGQTLWPVARYEQ